MVGIAACLAVVVVVVVAVPRMERDDRFVPLCLVLLFSLLMEGP